MVKLMKDVLCNKCNRKINQFDYCFEGVTFSIQPPYGSDFDGETYIVSLCDKCLKEFLISININPTP